MVNNVLAIRYEYAALSHHEGFSEKMVHAYFFLKMKEHKNYSLALSHIVMKFPLYMYIQDDLFKFSR